MAEVRGNPIIDGKAGRARFQWGPMAAGDVCTSLDIERQWTLLGSVQFTGTFGGTVTLQGSNDGTNWVDLKDPGGNAIAAAIAGAFEFSTAMAMIRPNPGAGVGAVTASICMRG